MITKVLKIDGSDFQVCPNGDVCKVVTYFGKSTDVKPIEGVINADVFYEMDTQNVFLFDEDTHEWILQ